ncbi:MAG: alpha/beta hydrolase [Burkholderiales bacterium]|nr:alpha/beta hydrolase [Burkholderiales bacterium]
MAGRRGLMSFVEVAGTRLEYVRLPSARPVSGRPVIVLLHEGLGSVSLWKEFPQAVADATGCEALVYSRKGYGQSDPITAPRAMRYMHDEALVVLPELLDRLAIERPVLFGHSDGGSIALIHAGGSSRPVAGLIVLAPHVLVEDISVTSIAEAKVAYETADLRERLAQRHANVESAFRGWNDIWLHPDFRAWNIEEYLPRVRVPVLAIQGEQDEYGTLDQIDRIARLAPDVETLKLADCRHSPHRDQPDAVIAATVDFVTRRLAR